MNTVINNRCESTQTLLPSVSHHRSRAGLPNTVNDSVESEGTPLPPGKKKKSEKRRRKEKNLKKSHRVFVLWRGRRRPARLAPQQLPPARSASYKIPPPDPNPAIILLHLRAFHRRPHLFLLRRRRRRHRLANPPMILSCAPP